MGRTPAPGSFGPMLLLGHCAPEGVENGKTRRAAPSFLAVPIYPGIVWGPGRSV
jgi:hypothetical protein